MPKFSDLIGSYNTTKTAADGAHAAVTTDQTKLTADQANAAAADTAEQANYDALAAAVALRQDGVFDPVTGTHYLTFGGQLHILHPDSADTDVPEAPAPAPEPPPTAGPAPGTAPAQAPRHADSHPGPGPRRR